MGIYFVNKKISDLKGDSFLKNITLDKIKKHTSILIIDDEIFPYSDALRKHDFSIEYKNDIQSLKDVEAYDVILCDVKGVGKFLGSQYEGAYLVKQIKEKYPNKVVISYTANNYDATYHSYMEFADATVRKGTSIEEWSELLDALLKEEMDPVVQWEKTREALLRAGVPTIQVAVIEARYVKSVQSRTFESMEKIYSNQHSIEADLIKSLLKSLLVKLIPLLMNL